MIFNNFPLDIQIEILVNIPSFRQLNKQFYKEGEHFFIQRYGSIPISYQEFLKYQIHFHGTVFKHDDYSLTAIYLRTDENKDTAIQLLPKPYSIESRYYCNSIVYTNSCPGDHYSKLEKNIKYIRTPVLYDLKSTFEILQNRNCFNIDYEFKKNYIDGLFKSNGSDFDNLIVILKYILYLAPIEDMKNIKLNIPLTFYCEKTHDPNYAIILNEIYQLGLYYYQLTLSSL